MVGEGLEEDAYGAEDAEYRVIDDSVTETEPQVLKVGDQFAVFDRWGDILPTDPAAKGLFRRDTRYLSRWELRLFGVRPLLLSAGNPDATTLTTDLANPDCRVGDEWIQHNTLHLSRTKFMSGAACLERIRIRNYSLARKRVSLTLCFEADFKDIFEVRGHPRAARGVGEVAHEADRIRFEYRARDGVCSATTVCFHPIPQTLGDGMACFELDLDAKGTAEILVEVCCDASPLLDAGDGFSALHEHQRAMRREQSAGAAVIGCSDPLLAGMLHQARGDLYLLTTQTEHGAYPYAGVPWFSAIFGRDGIIAALLAGWIDPAMQRGVIRVLAATQARALDPAFDAEPGKIVHEIRHGEMARMREVPFSGYYGTVDATPLFIVLVGTYVRQTGDLQTLREVWPNLELANTWIDRYGDLDGDGFVEYQAHTKNGLANQGWKDSNDSISHADGTLAEGPIALCEVQAYVHLAKQELAALARLVGRPDLATNLERQADDLRRRFDEAFWLEDLGTYALALDGRKQPCRAASSNAGHALFGGIALEERAGRVGASLLSETGFCDWGVRTLASDAARYNPMSYHNGSVWPHDNALIALGLARYGLKDGTVRILRALYEASLHMNLQRLPELMCGFARSSPGDGPTPYPVACSPQAWSSAAMLGTLKAGLGLNFDAHNRTLLLDRPALPLFIDSMTFERLSIANGSIDLELHQHGGAVAAHVRRRSGDIDVVVVH